MGIFKLLAVNHKTRFTGWFWVMVNLRFFQFHFDETGQIWLTIYQKISTFWESMIFFFFTWIFLPQKISCGKLFATLNSDFWQFHTIFTFFFHFHFFFETRSHFLPVSWFYFHFFLCENTIFWPVFVKKVGFTFNYFKVGSTGKYRVRTYACVCVRTCVLYVRIVFVHCVLCIRKVCEPCVRRRTRVHTFFYWQTLERSCFFPNPKDFSR